MSVVSVGVGGHASLLASSSSTLTNLPMCEYVKEKDRAKDKERERERVYTECTQLCRFVLLLVQGGEDP